MNWVAVLVVGLAYSSALGWFVANPLADRVISPGAGMLEEFVLGFAVVGALTAVALGGAVATVAIWGALA